ncbi:MAG: amidohydrolase, partial [Brevibacterium sp.]|nr:amidohydrolase [Brevibacterium sp.]
MSEIRDLSRPTVPDESYLGQMAAETQARSEQAGEWNSEFNGAPESSTAVLAAGLAAARADLDGLLHTIHSLAETAFAEHDSVRAIASVLGSRGIEVETGLFGVDTPQRAPTGA